MDVSNNYSQLSDQGYKTLGDRQRMDKARVLYAWWCETIQNVDNSVAYIGKMLRIRSESYQKEIANKKLT